MRRKVGSLFLALLVVTFSVCMSGCNRSDDAPPQAAEDEIKLIIQLDLKEDIGLLILDQNENGEEHSGGISNANKSKMKHNSTEYWEFHRAPDSLDKTSNLTIRFRIITEYCDPNYENDYPEEYTVLLDPISFEGEYGKTYHITITGDRESGYQAVLDADSSLQEN